MNSISNSKVFEEVAKAVMEMQQAFHDYWDQCLEEKRISLVLKEDIEKLHVLPGDCIVEFPPISVDCRFDQGGDFESFEVGFLLSSEPFSDSYDASEYSGFCSSPQFAMLKDNLEITQRGEQLFKVKGSFNISFSQLEVLLTDILSALGASGNTPIEYNLNFKYTKGDLSLAGFPDNPVVAPAVVNALKVCKEIASEMDLDNLECAPGLVISAGADEDCDVCLFLGNTCVSFDYMIEKEKFERIKKYKNIAAMDFSNDDSGYVYNRTAFAYSDLDFAARFLTDFALFLNPEKACENITATIDFGLWDGREDCRLIFHPDGGSPSADEIQRCLDRFGTE